MLDNAPDPIGQQMFPHRVTAMRIFLTGVGCVGKTTVGRELAAISGVKFFDVDREIETFFSTSIERLQKRFLTIHSYRNEAAKALSLRSH